MRLIADRDVLQGAVQRVAHVQLAGDVGGRHDDGEGAFVRVAVALKAAVLLPHLIDAALHLPGFIDLGQFFFHLLHSFSGQSKRARPKPVAQGEPVSPRYHLNSTQARDTLVSVTGEPGRPTPFRPAAPGATFISGIRKARTNRLLSDVRRETTPPLLRKWMGKL